MEELVGDGLVVLALSVAHDTRAEPQHQHVELHLAQRVVAVMVAFLHHGCRLLHRNLATDSAAPQPQHTRRASPQALRGDGATRQVGKQTKPSTKQQQKALRMHAASDVGR